MTDLTDDFTYSSEKRKEKAKLKKTDSKTTLEIELDRTI